MRVDLPLAVEMMQQRVEARLRLGIHPAGGFVEDEQLGVDTSARAMSTRCCCPTESAPTRAAAYAVMPTWAKHVPDAPPLGRAQRVRSRPMVATSPLATTSPRVTGGEDRRAFCGT